MNKCTASYFNECKDKGHCPVRSPPENVAMDKACNALFSYCSKGIAPDDPMSWIRGYLEHLYKQRVYFDEVKTGR